jgi:hypothetical protein
MAYDLKIRLSSPYDRGLHGRYTFGPNETVSGKVVFSPKSEETVESISVEFKGKVKTRHGSDKNQHSYEDVLFFHTQNLFKGPYKMRAATYEYPFSFTCPESFDYRGASFRDEGVFKGTGGTGPGKLPCPPSCRNDAYGCGDGFGGGGEVEVHYHITARIPRTFTDWEDRVNLNFSPWRKELHVREERKKATPNLYVPEHVHYRVTHEGVPRPLTKMEAFKESVKKKPETKTVNFSLAATAPTQIVIGEPYQMEITLVSNNAEELGIVPEFRIQSYELLLKETTDLRVPGVFTDHVTYLDGHVPLSSNAKLEKVLPPNKSMMFNGMFPEKSARGAYPAPTFTSFCVRRTYGLELKAVVECLGETRRFKIHWANVKLYPARMEPGVEEAMRSIEAETASLDVGLEESVVEGLPVYKLGDAQGEGLPRYEKHVDGNSLDL